MCFASSILLLFGLYFFTQTFKKAYEKLLSIVLEVSLKERTVFIKDSLEVASVDNFLTVCFGIAIDLKHFLE